MKTVTLCGSMRFEAEMQRIAFLLEIKFGYNVLQCVYNPDALAVTEKDLTALENAHLRRIELSDAVYVVDIDGYVGEQVRNEIAFAESLGKEVIYHSSHGC